MSGYEGKHPDDLVQAANVDAPKSLRDELALAALNGFCSNPAVFAHNYQCGWGLVNSTPEILVRYCYELADEAMEIRKE